MRAGVIDDVREEAKALSKMLKASDVLTFKSVETFSSTGDLLEGLRGRKPLDVLFVDVHLDETDGVNLAARLSDAGLTSQIVFVSGYDTYHTRVYRTPHTAYLKKPYNQEDVDEALRLVIHALGEGVDTPLAIRHKGVVNVIPSRDILFMESSLRLIKVHTEDEFFETYGKLGDLLEQLPDHFVRCHQSFVVNLDAIESLDSDTAHLIDGRTVPVSRRMRTTVRRALLKHIRNSE